MKQPMFPEVQTRPISEEHLFEILCNAGGRRAYTDDSRQNEKNADFILGDTVIELKCLEGDGLDHEPRQKKVAKLFREAFPERPTIVLHRDFLSDRAKNDFDNILASGIKGHIRKAAKQLKQTRQDLPSARNSVLLLVNNGYSSLSHDELTSLVLKRVQNDTRSINGVIVAGSYVHSDSFDTFALWPFELFPVDDELDFAEFEQLRAAWNSFANDYMTKLLLGDGDVIGSRAPVSDNVFEYEEVRFVRPAPSLGTPSQFFIHGRPRENSSGISACPPVATSFPALTQRCWDAVHGIISDPWTLGTAYEDFLEIKKGAIDEQRDDFPLVPVRIDPREWAAWCDDQGRDSDSRSLFEFTNAEFSSQLREMIGLAQSSDRPKIIPATYVLVVTEVIGQDMANDVSHIAIIREQMGDSSPYTFPLIENKRMFHEHALALGGAYAIRDGIETLVWSKDGQFGWV